MVRDTRCGKRGVPLARASDSLRHDADVNYREIDGEAGR
jgi:hypothetical protein